MKFELLVAIRYLKAKRRQAVISLITVISVVGVAAGVGALIVALAINAGFREDLQSKLLGATAHVAILSKGPEGLANYERLTREIAQIPQVVSAEPAVYATVLLSTAIASRGTQLKGVTSVSPENLVQGDASKFKDNAIIVGQELANELGTYVGDKVRIISSDIKLTPLGGMPVPRVFEVAGIFSSGLYEQDAAWAYVPIRAAQRLMGYGDVAGLIEIEVQDIYQANAVGRAIVDRIGPGYQFTDWMTTNRSIFQALRLERLVMFITIGLIVLVAALNIVATLIMMVLEKTRDIAILMSMGATQDQIRRIFICQGVVIGIIGTFFGVILGNGVSYFADKYHLISLAPDVYTIAYVPFRPQPIDSAIVAVLAILISFLATLYPSAAASKLQPVEALRYE